MTELSFAGRRVVVTGAGRGLGREYALLLAARGAQVAVVDLGSRTDGLGADGDDPAAAVVNEITAAGGEAIAIQADVSTEESAADIVGKTVSAFGGLDALVNNAGVVRIAAFQDVSLAEYQRHLDVHYFGSLWMAKAAWPHLKASGSGRVLNTISGAMLAQGADMTHYGSSKGAVFGLTRNLALAGVPDGILVNAIAPGAGTRMADASADALPPEIVEFMRTSMLASMVAPVAAYLVHPTCTVTGEVFNAAAGIVNRMVVVNSTGIYDTEMTLEKVAAQWEQIMALPDGVEAQVIPTA